PIETFIPATTPAPASTKTTSSGKRRNRKTCFVCKSVDHLIKDYNYRAKKMAQPTQRNYEHRGRNLGANGPTSIGFDMSKVECYNCHMKGHFARECRSLKDTRRNVMTRVFKQKRSLPTMLLWPSHFQVLLLTMRDNALVSLRQNLEKVEHERDDLKLKLEKFQTSSKHLAELLASQTNAKTGLGYNSQVFTHAMFDCDDYLYLGSDESLPPSPIYDRYQLGNGYHAIPPPYTETFMPPKPDLVFNNAPNDVKTDHPAFNVKLSPTKPDQDLSHTLRPSTPIIEDWVSNLEDESKTKTPQIVPIFVQLTEQVKSPRPFVQHVETFIQPATSKTAISKPTSNGKRKNRKACFVPVSTAVPKISVTRPRQAKTVVTKTNSPPRRHITCIPSPKASKFPPKVTVVKAPMVNAAKGNPQHALKDKGVIDSGCSRHMTGNISYQSDFEELNGGYVAFGGNPQGGKISRKGLENQLSLKVKVIKSDNETEFKNNDLNQFCGMKGIKRELSVPRTPQQNGIAERKNKTLIEAARTMLADSLLPIPFWAEVDEGFLVGYSVSSKAFKVFNSRTRIVQETLHVNFLENKPNVVGSDPIWLFDIDTLTKTMNYQPVTAGNQSNPSAGVQEQFDAKKAREEINQQYVLFPVWFSGFTNPQNTDGDAAFDEKEPEFEGRKPEFEVNVSLSSSAQSKKHDDKTKREAKGKKLEDITYSDDEADVGAEANFNNLETSIIVSPIPTTRVYKDHPIQKSDAISKGSYQVAKLNVAKWNGTKVSVKIPEKDIYSEPQSIFYKAEDDTRREFVVDHKYSCPPNDFDLTMQLGFW
nr:putative ribonuclease H-like domain-containing protein [Tanacetum cinerariifolium]